ncbi:hypothetical protein [Polaribacter porphyrae]|uniref:Fibronectin type-III domain-containing protein n=1 Tax=Polaribacter porphyrae TaxID=1137780 RepID=A0A2S7WP40_9FLAO|nr:hypothetical protein [Polaribacter porphyrae]PQJ79370.1 hypothetical protein BTO18_09375 [Polaribacter porphyrae]
MRKALLIFAFVCFTYLSCSKKQAVNNPPSSVNLIFPTDNLLCINNTIPFNWSNATDPEDDDLEYNLIIAKDRALTNVVENRTIATSAVTITLEKGTAYYWKVDAVDANNNQSTASSTSAFFTKGEGVANHAPFTSELLTPQNNTSVAAGTVNLTWNGGDADATDTLTYELYFGEGSNLSLIDDAISDKTYLVTIDAGKTYSWKVNVKDQNGAKSIGQTWSFAVN